jgi:tRNA-specific 2-thiouridylase
MPREKVAVAMSGGVDSSVAAAFLVKKGCDVFGLTMELTGRESRCCSMKDINDAREVANRLSIPHYVIPMQDLFRRRVIDYFIGEYVRGRTPNPCAVCNPAVKFGALMEKAVQMGAGHLATGHYAVVKHDAESGRFLLIRAREKGKDQSYFLSRLPQQALKRALFPIGNFSKPKIRELAARFGLGVAEKTESMDACFLPDMELTDFIENETGIPLESGPLVDENGSELGRHRGIAGYTIGQRKGLGIAAGVPVYVTRIHADTNTLVVGPKDKLYHRELTATDPVWISVDRPAGPMRARVRIRYRHRPAWASVELSEHDRVKVHFDSPQRAITPGQLAVFYDSETVLGSAWIDEVL